MPIMKDLKTGEEKEISMEEFFELTQGEELCIEQVVRNADGSEVSSVLYGEEENDGRLHAMNFFATMNSVIRAAAVMSEEVKKKYPNTTKVFRMSNENLDYEVMVDDMNAPLMYIFRFSKEGVHVQSYVRDERRSITGTPTIDQRYSFVNGEISAEVSDIQADYILCFVFGVYEIIQILEDNGVLLQLQEMKNQGCGILVTGEEDVSLKIVQGHERPELPCMLFGGMFAKSADDTVMMRPYVDELFVSNLQEDDEELEQTPLGEEKEEEKKRRQEEKKQRIEAYNMKRKGVKNVKNMIHAAQSSYFVITPDGNVIAGGTNQNLIQMVSSWKNIIQITGGDKHIVGLKEDGTVVAAGDNYFGQCDVWSWRDIVSIAAGYNHTVGLKKDGTVVAVGNNDTYYNYYKQSSKGCCSVKDWKDIIAIAAGSGSTVGLKKDGKVIVVGDCCKPSVDYSNNEYKANNIENWPPVIEIAAHDAYVYGITAEGNLVTTAIHIRGEKWKNIISIFAPFNGNTELIAVREDGSVVGCWRRNEDWEVEFKKYGNVICAVGETAYNDNVNVLCLRMDGTFSGNPSGGFMSVLKGLKLFNNPNTIYQERIESVKRMIEQKKDELANTKGLFSGGKKRTLQNEISQLEEKLDKLKEALSYEPEN